MALSRHLFKALCRPRTCLPGASLSAIERLAVSSLSKVVHHPSRNRLEIDALHKRSYHSCNKCWDNELAVPFPSRLGLWRLAVRLNGAARFLTTDKVSEQPDDDVPALNEIAGDLQLEEGLIPDTNGGPRTLNAVEEAALIGYKVVGRIKAGDMGHFKPPKAFAIVQVGSHQFKISPGDCIYTEKLKYADVNDKLCLDKVLMLGSRSQTIIGRPVVPKAAVHAVVEEQTLDAKVIIFKKKRRKNYRRTRGHRQELTRLRILDIRGLGEARSAVI